MDEKQKVLDQMNNLIHNMSNLTIDNDQVNGYNFNQGIDFQKIFDSYRYTGI
jgi:hypothetical protein